MKCCLFASSDWQASCIQIQTTRDQKEGRRRSRSGQPGGGGTAVLLLLVDLHSTENHRIMQSTSLELDLIVSKWDQIIQILDCLRSSCQYILVKWTKMHWTLDCCSYLFDFTPIVRQTGPIHTQPGIPK